MEEKFKDQAEEAGRLLRRWRLEKLKKDELEEQVPSLLELSEEEQKIIEIFAKKA